MATYKSDLYPTNPGGYAKIDASKMYGKERVFYFQFTTPSGGVAVNDVIKLAELPPGARVIQYGIAFEAMGTSTTADIGLASDAARYKAGLSVASAGNSESVPTIDTIPDPNVTTMTDDFQVTVKGADWSGSKKLQGYVRVVVQ